MKKIIIAGSIFIALVLAFSIGKNLIVESGISMGVRAATGLKLSMESLNVDVFRTLIAIKGLKLYNPGGFEDKVMLDMPEVYIDYSLKDFLRRRIHLEEIRLDLKEFYVIKNRNGELNLDTLKALKEEKGQKEEKAPSKEKRKAARFQIDELQLKIGRVTYKDYSKGPSPKVTDFNVNINERHKNITHPNTLAQLIIFKALLKTTISDLTDFDLRAIKTKTEDVLGGVKDKALDTIKGILNF